MKTSKYWNWLLRLALLALITRTGVKGEWLRCFCTEARCVQTNYMCKTHTGSCYSRMIFNPGSGQLISTRHGCDDDGILPPLERPGTCRSMEHLIRDEDNETTDNNLSSLSSTFLHEGDDSTIESESDDWEFSWKGRKRHNIRPLKGSTIVSIEKSETESHLVSENSRNLIEIPNELESETIVNLELGEKIKSSNFKIKSSESDNKNKQGKQNGGHQRIDEQRITVTCCNDDMCNYVEDDERMMDKMRGTSLSTSISTNDRRTDDNIQHRDHFITALSHSHANSDIWFKMAVCLVTVIGAAILVVIVVSAMRMLRSEKRNFRRQQLYCDCPHYVIDAVLVAGDASSKQQLLFPAAESGGYYKSPLASPCSIEQQGIV